MITLAIFALLIFGPKKLPEVARTAGKVIRNLRSATAELSEELKAGLEDPATERPPPSRSEDLPSNGFPRPGPR